jgi:hypothetical protein
LESERGDGCNIVNSINNIELYTVKQSILCGDNFTSATRNARKKDEAL